MSPETGERAAQPADGDSVDPLLGTTLAERYRIEALIGKGGMGTVYRATHIHMRKTLAIKVLRPEMAENEEVVARFEREAIAAGHITHEHVVSATDFGRAPNGSFYLVMEHVPGATLSAVLSRGAIGTERALAIARQIAEALEAAHGLGIVHRDLKPDNVILVDKMGMSDFVKVLDFGIARFTAPGTKPAQDLTQIGAVFGTPQYMAPEQAAGKPVDHRADLYALGVILFEMLAGRPPFQNDTIPGLLVQQLTEEPPPLPEGTAPEVDALVRGLLDKQADTRIQSASEVIDAIDGIVSGVPSGVLTARARTAPAAPNASAAPRPAASPQPAKRRSAWVWGVGVAAASVGFLVAWRTASSEPAPSPELAASAHVSPAAAASVSRAAASATALPSTPPSAAVAQPAPAPSSSTTAGAEPVDAGAASEADAAGGGAAPSKASAQRSGTTSKTTKTTKTSKTRTTKKTKTTKRRTGPGGIYIPPPSTWFD